MGATKRRSVGVEIMSTSLPKVVGQRDLSLLTADQQNPPPKYSQVRKESHVNDSVVVEGFESRCQKVLKVAKDLHARKPDWVTFFRETLGVSGAARSVFPKQEDYVQFEQSQEFAEIQQLVATLRTRKAASGKNEATRVITVRLPESLHESLKAEAADHNTSMNKLCISKLLQALIEEEEAQREAQARQNASAQAQQNAAVQARQSAPVQSGHLPQPSQPMSSVNPAQPAQRPRPAQDGNSGFRSTYGQ